MIITPKRILKGETDSELPNLTENSLVSEYSFLRNLWTHQFKDVSNDRIDNEDRIDRLNKIVGMVKTRVQNRVQREMENSNQSLKKKSHPEMGYDCGMNALLSNPVF